MMWFWLAAIGTLCIVFVVLLFAYPRRMATSTKLVYTTLALLLALLFTLLVLRQYGYI